jgi:hypothetical protein
LNVLQHHRAGTGRPMRNLQYAASNDENKGLRITGQSEPPGAVRCRDE